VIGIYSFERAARTLVKKSPLFPLILQTERELGIDSGDAATLVQ